MAGSVCVCVCIRDIYVFVLCEKGLKDITCEQRLGGRKRE